MTRQGSDLVSVVLPVHNGETYLAEAIESVCRQNHRELELLVVDDASTDRSQTIAESYADRDDRIRVLSQPTNTGLPAALNRGIREASGTFIARLDCDDRMLPNRLVSQVEFLNRHPEFVVVGGAARVIDANGRQLFVKRMPDSDEEVRWHEMTSRSSSFFHPSVMMRAETLRRHDLSYDESLRSAQDKQMWFQLLRVGRGRNLKAPMIEYRRHEASISTSRAAEQRQNAERVCLSWVRDLLGESIDARQVSRMLEWNRPVSADDWESWKLCRQLLDAFQKQPGTCPKQVGKIRVQLGLRFLRYAHVAAWPALLRKDAGRLAVGCGPADVLRYGLSKLGD